MRWAWALALLLGASGAQGQGLAYTPFATDPTFSGSFVSPPLTGQVNLNNTYINLQQTDNRIVSPLAQPGDRFGYVSIGDLLAASGSASQADLSTALAGIAARLDRLNARFSEGVALSSAITIMPPNPGDRFAVTVSGAGFNGRGAGSISGTYRLRDDVFVFGGYARSERENLGKVGATFSFR